MRILKAASATVVILSLGGLAVWQQAQIRSLRVEMGTLRGEAAEVTLLREENKRIAKVQPSPEPYEAQPDLRELLRLRGEVGVLKQQVAEAAKAHVQEMERSVDTPREKPGSVNSALGELKSKLDAAKRREEHLVATLNVPEQVMKFGIVDALDAESMDAYRTYFEARRDREEMERFQTVLKAKLRWEANNVRGNTSEGLGK